MPCSPSPDRQGRDRPEVAPRPRQIDPSEQMLRLASAPRIRSLRAGSRTILAPMGRPPTLAIPRCQPPDPCNKLSGAGPPLSHPSAHSQRVTRNLITSAPMKGDQMGTPVADPSSSQTTDLKLDAV